ncbi:MAG: 6,7-dimethyl-8-ribityllumazine synthase [Bacteroidales bacterium]|nr:6,7-dimethyl-8-ribityllumazine synthase [Bacteroidales bacterium]
MTSQMLEGALDTLKQFGVETEDIFVSHVPSVLELTFAARQMSITQEPKAVIMLGYSRAPEDAGLQFSPQHHSAMQSVVHGYTELNLHSEIPYIFGVVTDLDVSAYSCGKEIGSKCACKVQSMVNMMANLVIK